MKICFEKTGGIGGLIGEKPPKIINTSLLPLDSKRKIEDIIKQSNFFKMKSSSFDEKGADFFEYTITIEDESQKHSITTNDIILRNQPTLKNLIAALKELPSKQ